MFGWFRQAFMLAEHFIRSEANHTALPLYVVMLPCQWSMPNAKWGLLYLANDVM